jgi:hypothetical protein
VEWKNAGIRISAEWQYAHSGTDVGMLSGKKAGARIEADWLYAHRGTKSRMLSGRRMMPGYKQIDNVHTAGQKLV